MSKKSLDVNSDKGDSFQISLAASAEQKLKTSSQEIQSCIIWSAGTDIYVNLYSDADANKFKLPADVLFPVPVDDLKDVSVFNNDASTAIVYVMWRGR
jgi:hypothetical protein